MLTMTVNEAKPFNVHIEHNVNLNHHMYSGVFGRAEQSCDNHVGFFWTC